MDATVTKIENTSPSERKPSDAVCPVCNAPIGGQCYVRTAKGDRYINWFHIARIEAAFSIGTDTGTKAEEKTEDGERTEAIA
jgi:hypothetical protein